MKRYIRYALFVLLSLAALRQQVNAAEDVDAAVGTLCRSQIELGRFADCISLVDERVGLTPGKQDAGLQLLKARALMEQGKYRKALLEVEKLEALPGGEIAPEREAEILNLSGALHVAAGNVTKAKDRLDRALAAAQNAKDTTVAAKVLHNMAVLERYHQNRPGEAVELIRKALELSQRSADAEGVAKLYISYANALHDMADDSAEEKIALAQEKLRALPGTVTRARGLLVVGDWYEECADRVRGEATGGYPDKAKKAYAEALETALRLHLPRLSSRASGSIGGIEEREGRLDDALRHTRAAIFHAQQASDSHLLYLWQWQGARILKAQGLQKDALVLYRLAVRNLQGDREFYDQSNTGYFQKKVKPVYLELAELLLAEASSLQDAKQAQDTLEELLETVQLLRSDELKDYLRDPCFKTDRPAATVQTLAGKGVAFVHYLVLGSRIEALVKTGSGIERFTVSAPVGEVSRDIVSLREKIRHKERDYLSLSQKLYDLLLRPVAATIAGTTLVVVPDGLVRALPIAALHDGERFVIEKHVVETAQLTLVGAAPHTPPGDFLIGGISRSVRDSEQLPFVEQELDDIYRIYSGKLLKNENFTTTALAKEMKEHPYRVLHIASHGVFAENAADSYLLAWDDNISMQQLGEIVEVGKYRKAPLQLVTLSACSTALGGERASLGLAGVASKAGARTVIASLWNINDQATSKFFSLFYRIMKETPMLSAAEVLRQAQLKLLHDTPPAPAAPVGKEETMERVATSEVDPAESAMAAPYFWAPFILVRDGF